MTTLQNKEIGPGESEQFEFAFTGVGVTDLDFVGDLSEFDGGGNTQTLAAAKFVRGPGDESAFGATVLPVPEPSVATLLGLGVAVLTLLRRSRPGFG